AVPPPLPPQPKAAEPIRLQRPVAAPAPATVKAGAPARSGAGGFRADQEDQYDIPAFLRRGPRSDG
ncbi:MAG TPA: cell division protein FtsZ, partial [Anaeromyxobacteraceae bacterium]|nr:cell division protein FtsZ [Anaeromyxobacteraceae bacterium]